MTTNKFVRLEDVQKILGDSKQCLISNETWNKIESIPTYPEPTKWSNHALLEEYIDKESIDDMWKFEIKWLLEEIQSRLTEWTEYEVGKEYEVSMDWDSWFRRIFSAYQVEHRLWYEKHGWELWNHIRPIQPVSPELTSAISVLEANWYTVCKK
jgi:hypothetical protein